jgi:hypothetical protein
MSLSVIFFMTLNDLLSFNTDVVEDGMKILINVSKLLFIYTFIKPTHAVIMYSINSSNSISHP